MGIICFEKNAHVGALVKACACWVHSLPVGFMQDISIVHWISIYDRICINVNKGVLSCCEKLDASIDSIIIFLELAHVPHQ